MYLVNRFIAGVSLFGLMMCAEVMGNTEMRRYLQGKSEDGDVCPFIYDSYVTEIKVAGTTVDFEFSPAKYGFSHGYYCSITDKKHVINYRFNNCSCPIGRFCDDTWGVIESEFLGQMVGFNVGRCRMYWWVLIIPIVAAFLLACCFACFCTRLSKARRQVIVIREDPRTDYVSLN
uniref:CX domain-containing protein n=1 Tax=Mucochytrium quahogii TaxID=96639 RepID=A0A7S2SKW5_9STRA|mmetsp:Transcript_15345/g.25017  ORF Transcript_15345/g.25017 Transcript_15345/m.25017 type:complete len:175 (-) Transcript_15345:24-548(-)